jgi:hypothetical protein
VLPSARNCLASKVHCLIRVYAERCVMRTRTASCARRNRDEGDARIFRGWSGCWGYLRAYPSKEPCATYCCSTRTAGDGARRARWRLASYQGDPSYKGGFISHCRGSKRSAAQSDEERAHILGTLKQIGQIVGGCGRMRTLGIASRQVVFHWDRQRVGVSHLI